MGLTQISPGIPQHSHVDRLVYSPALKLLAVAVGQQIYVCGEDAGRGWHVANELKPFGNSGSPVSSMLFLGQHADQLFVGSGDRFG